MKIISFIFLGVGAAMANAGVVLHNMGAIILEATPYVLKYYQNDAPDLRTFKDMFKEK